MDEESLLEDEGLSEDEEELLLLSLLQKKTKTKTASCGTFHTVFRTVT